MTVAMIALGPEVMGQRLIMALCVKTVRIVAIFVVSQTKDSYSAQGKLNYLC